MSTTSDNQEMSTSSLDSGRRINNPSYNAITSSSDVALVAPNNEGAGGAKGKELYCSGLVGWSGRERLKRHREEVAGRVVIPDKWSQEELLREWMDYSSFNALLAPKGVASARQALMSQARTSQRLRIEGRC